MDPTEMATGTIRRGAACLLLLAALGLAAGVNSVWAATAPDASTPPDLTVLEGFWVATLEGIRLNDATGSYVGATLAVNGDRFRLEAGDASTEGSVPAGPTEIFSCSAKSCVLGRGLPRFITVLDDGTVAIVDMRDQQDDAGASICGAPVVDDAGVVTIDPASGTLRFVTGIAGGHGAGSGDDPCAGASYQIVWTEVLTRAPWVVPTEPPGAEPSVAAPTIRPSAPPSGAAPSEDPGTGGSESGDHTDPVPAFTRAIPSPATVVTDPSVVATSAILALLAVLLVPFPGMLFNSTLETNYAEVRGWFRRGRRTDAAAASPTIGEMSARGGFWASPLGVIAFLLLSAVLYGFLDPGFGFAASTVPMYIGTVLGLSIVTALAFVGPWTAHARLGERGRLRALPGTLLVAAVCVLISRLTGFLPGYLYGLLVALEFARSLDRNEGRLAATSAATLLGAAGLAWLILGLLPTDADSALGAVATTALASIVVAALEGVVFGLVPLRFLPGAAIFAWNRVVWAILYGIGVFGFLHVLLDPDGGYLASSARTPLFTIVALLVGFGVVSVAFWAYFRFRPERPVDAAR